MTRTFRNKADAELAAKLMSAASDDDLTVILEIAQPMDSDSLDQSDLDENVPLTGTDRARIAVQLEIAARAVNGTVVGRLDALGLKPRGGRYASVIVVTGKPDDLCEAIMIDSVCRATLDGPLDLIGPDVPGEQQKQ